VARVCGDGGTLKSAALARIEEPKIVQTETVKAEPAVVTLPDSPEKQPVAKRKPKRHVERDVCPGVRLRNEKGVVLELRGAKLGVEVSANLALITITMK
jgi:hypothetical protein